MTQPPPNLDDFDAHVLELRQRQVMTSSRTPMQHAHGNSLHHHPPSLQQSPGEDSAYIQPWQSSPVADMEEPLSLRLSIGDMDDGAVADGAATNRSSMQHTAASSGAPEQKTHAAATSGSVSPAIITTNPQSSNRTTTVGAKRKHSIANVEHDTPNSDSPSQVHMHKKKSVTNADNAIPLPYKPNKSLRYALSEDQLGLSKSTPIMLPASAPRDKTAATTTRVAAATGTITSASASPSSSSERRSNVMQRRQDDADEDGVLDIMFRNDGAAYSRSFLPDAIQQRAKLDAQQDTDRALSACDMVISCLAILGVAGMNNNAERCFSGEIMLQARKKGLPPSTLYMGLTSALQRFQTRTKGQHIEVQAGFDKLVTELRILEAKNGSDQWL